MHDALSHECALTRALTQHTIMRCFSTRTFARVSLGALMYIQIHAHYILLPWLAHALFSSFILPYVNPNTLSFILLIKHSFIHLFHSLRLVHDSLHPSTTHLYSCSWLAHIIINIIIIVARMIMILYLFSASFSMLLSNIWYTNARAEHLSSSSSSSSSSLSANLNLLILN